MWCMKWAPITQPRLWRDWETISIVKRENTSYAISYKVGDVASRDGGGVLHKRTNRQTMALKDLRTFRVASRR